MNPFEAKRAARIERLQARAAKARAQAESTYKDAAEMASAIPLGQPVASNSNRQADLNYRAKLRNKFEKSFEQMKKADHLQAKADAAASNTSISSDDPDAIKKLEEKLAKYTANYEATKAIYKAEGRALGYRGVNATAEIRRLKKRIEELKKRAAQESKEYTLNGVRIVENTEANRIQLFFDGKPSEEMRQNLKGHGFRWSPSVGAWQAFLSSKWKIKYLFQE